MGSAFRIDNVSEENAKPNPRESPSRRALRTETRGLILVALVIFAVYLVRYLHLLHRSAP